MAEAAGEMVIDHAGGLGKGIDNHRAAEIEAALFELLGQAFAHLGLGGDLPAALEAIDLRLAADMLPDHLAKAAGFLFLDLQPKPGALDGGLDLGAAADDAVIPEQPVHIPRAIAGDS